ncbi:30S ribosome-binding factor RbfA [Rhodospirillaceae bacterium KN72]|uniref:Ribosome-binding factor A n=1 Tax=Pacificispira spongiicola TaxID=2729598 RepID=A0A7Y0E0E6_9PROT|nr:30S ribosome-binding factor RbfA [Pacificispira spongiicola]NMM44929.1 30S ribosome-binding factor RbfA [Pacificispira spongiicola]
MSDREPSQRQLRVGEQIRHALSRILSRGELRDPILSGTPITVSEVRCSPDLKLATAYIMPLGGQNVDDVVAALKRAGAFLRGQVAKEIRLKYTPGLRFLPDESFEEADRIERLLKTPEVQRDLLTVKEAEDEEEDD